MPLQHVAAGPPAADAEEHRPRTAGALVGALAHAHPGLDAHQPPALGRRQHPAVAGEVRRRHGARQGVEEAPRAEGCADLPALAAHVEAPPGVPPTALPRRGVVAGAGRELGAGGMSGGGRHGVAQLTQARRRHPPLGLEDELAGEPRRLVRGQPDHLVGALTEDLVLGQLLEVGPRRQRGRHRGVLLEALGGDVGAQVGGLPLGRRHRPGDQVQLLQPAHQLVPVPATGRRRHLQGSPHRVLGRRPLVLAVGAIHRLVAVTEVDRVLGARRRPFALDPVPRRPAVGGDAGRNTAHVPLDRGQALPRGRLGDQVGHRRGHRPRMPQDVRELLHDGIDVVLRERRHVAAERRAAGQHRLEAPRRRAHRADVDGDARRPAVCGDQCSGRLRMRRGTARSLVGLNIHRPPPSSW